MKKTLRLFIAVPLPEKFTVFLKETQGHLQNSKINFRWVPVRNIHLTLKFLGDVEKSAIAEIAAKMDAAAVAVTPFTLTAEGVGGFPSLRKPRVLWVGLGEGTCRLAALQSRLEGKLASIGFKKERRRFHPHLTIGRARQRIPGLRLESQLKAFTERASKPFQVDRICLYASTLKSTGAEYTRLHTTDLTGRSSIGASDALEDQNIKQ
jgi:2'-5' RNA ligase